MKSIKELREHYQVITEKEDKEQRKLTALVRAGLFDAKKLPMLKRALEKGVDKMTSAEKKILIDLLDSLMNQVVSNEPVYMKVKRNVQSMDEEVIDEITKTPVTISDVPSIVVLKRKAVRVYPGGQQVGLYYSQQLDKYVTIPFGEAGMSEEVINEAVPPPPPPTPPLPPRRRLLYRNRDQIDRDIDADYDTLSSQRRKKLTVKTLATKGFERGGVQGGIIAGTLGILLPKMKKRRLKRLRRTLPESYDNQQIELDENIVKLITSVPALAKGAGQILSKGKGVISKYMAKRAARKKALERLNRMKSKNKNAKGGRKGKRGDLVDIDYDAGGYGGAGSSAPTINRSLFAKDVVVKKGQGLNITPVVPEYRKTRTSLQARADNLQTQANKAMLQKESVEVNLDGNLVEINSSIAEKLVNVYESLNNYNKQKMVDMLLNEDTQNKIVEFIRRY